MKMASAQYTPSPFPCSIVVVQTSGRHGKTFKFERKNWCVLGANKDCDIIVPFPGVAQLQALIHVKRNGVFLQGIDKQIPVRHPRLKKEMLDEEEVMILPGDIFLLGNREFLIEYSAEDVCIETGNSIAQTLSGMSSGSRKTTPRVRRRRKSSIMVGEFDETYVLPTNGSEKLLSDYQLARVSKSEAEILPEQEGQPTCKDDESHLSHKSSKDLYREEEVCLRSFSSDDSATFSSEEGSVSGTINFPQESKSHTFEQVSTASSVRSKVASEKKQRRNLVFDRLSKGLPATPRRRDKDPTFDQHELRLQTTTESTSSNGANTASGKENIPLHATSNNPDEKKGKDVPSTKDLENTRSIRSPLASRVELENQASPPPTRIRALAPKGLLESARARKSSAQTPRSRSVAFAASIELAPGAHYSPFRPRKMTTNRGSATRVKKNAKEVTEKVKRSATRSKDPSMQSLSALQREDHLLKQSVGTSGPALNMRQFEKAANSQGSSADTICSEGKPVVEYEDDSNPPTPSSSEAENEASHLPTLPEPSPMARVGGALAGFLKRLSGNFESDEEDDSSFETDSDYAHKRLSFSEDLDESSKQDMPPTQALVSPEPVMSSVELEKLSETVPPEQRHEFVNQVLSAAKDVQAATNPVYTECHGQPLNSDERKSDCQTWTSPMQDKEAEDCPMELPASEPGAPKPPPLSLGLSSDVSVEAQQNTLKTDDRDDNSTNGSIGSELHSSTGSSDSDGREAPELEMEMEVVRNMNVNEEADETDDEDAVERDYGDDPWDDLDVGEGNESDEREIAAVVLEHDGDVHDVTGFVQTSTLGKKTESGFEHQKVGNPRDEYEVEHPANEPHTRNLHPSAKLPTDNNHRASTLVQGRDLSDGSSASDTEEPSSADSDLSSASSTGNDHSLKYDAGDAKHSTSSSEEETEERSTAVAVQSNELEASKKELSRLKKDELKKRLDQRGLDTEGLKKDLIERLVQAMTFPTPKLELEKDPSDSESQCPEKSDEEMVDLKHASAPSTCIATPRRSNERIPETTPTRSRASTRRLTRQSLAGEQSTAQAPETSETAHDAKSNASSENTPDVSLYRRRTMRELRQFLKNRGLDTQLKMKKDELIQHLISHSIGSDGQVLEESTAPDVKKPLAGNTTQALEKPLPKSSQKMTVVQIRALLREQGQCQAGTKKILLERLTTHPERRTRSRRVLDNTSCAFCKEGKACEATGKK